MVGKSKIVDPHPTGVKVLTEIACPAQISPLPLYPEGPLVS